MKPLFRPLTAAEIPRLHPLPLFHPSVLRSPLPALVYADNADIFINYRAHTDRLAALLTPAALVISVGLWAAVQVFAR